MGAIPIFSWLSDRLGKWGISFADPRACPPHVQTDDRLEDLDLTVSGQILILE